jgi:hypothetical protein
MAPKLDAKGMRKAESREKMRVKIAIETSNR